MGSIAVNLYIEDVTTTCKVMVWSLNLCLMAGCAMIVYRHVVRVGLIFAVCNALDNAKLCTGNLSEAATQAFGRSCKHTIVMMITF